MKRFLALLLALSLVMASGISLAEAAHEPVTLRFSWWGGDARHEATLKVIEQFEALYPWINIEAEYSAFDGYNEKKMTEFASKTAPDLFQIETGSGPEYYQKGVLANLTELGMDFSNFDDAFLTANGKFGSGAQYGVPVSQAGSAFVVNKDVAEKFGLDFTKEYTWDDLLTWGKAVHEADPEVYLLNLNTRYATAFFMRAWGRQVVGKSMIDNELNLNLTVEDFTRMFEYIKALYDNNVAPPASYKAAFGEADQEDPNWIAGKYVGTLTYTSMCNVLAAACPDGNFYAGNLPLMPDRVSDGWFNDCSGYIGVYSGSEHKEEAVMFLDYFFNNETALATLGTVRSVPPTALGKQICAESGALDALTKQAVEVSGQYNGVSDAGKTTTSECEAILRDCLENVAYGAMTPADAAAEIVELLNDYIAAQR